MTLDLKRNRPITDMDIELDDSLNLTPVTPEADTESDYQDQKIDQRRQMQHKKKKNQNSQLLNRWPRAFARLFDLAWQMPLVIFIVASLLEFYLNEYYSFGYDTRNLLNIYSADFYVLLFVSLPLALLLDGVIAGFFGVTPAKALIGVKTISARGEKLGLTKQIYRNYGVWTDGLGLGLFPITLLTMWQQFRRISGRREASYDERIHVRMRSADSVSALRTFAAVPVLLGLMFLALILPDLTDSTDITNKAEAANAGIDKSADKSSDSKEVVPSKLQQGANGVESDVKAVASSEEKPTQPASTLSVKTTTSQQVQEDVAAKVEETASAAKTATNEAQQQAKTVANATSVVAKESTPTVATPAVVTKAAASTSESSIAPEIAPEVAPEIAANKTEAVNTIADTNDDGTLWNNPTSGLSTVLSEDFTVSKEKAEDGLSPVQVFAHKSGSVKARLHQLDAPARNLAESATILLQRQRDNARFEGAGFSYELANVTVWEVSGNTTANDTLVNLQAVQKADKLWVIESESPMADTDNTQEKALDQLRVSLWSTFTR